MSNPISYRQGDVLLIKVDDALELNEEACSSVLAEGEITGHKHEVIGGTVHTRKWYSEPKYVQSTGKTTLVHPEHGHIKINKGLFEVRIQREYDELSNRYVAD